MKGLEAEPNKLKFHWGSCNAGLSYSHSEPPLNERPRGRTNLVKFSTLSLGQENKKRINWFKCIAA